MPDMANITVKQSDGVTDVTFTKVTASGGDKSPAVWRNDSFGGTQGQRPELRVKSQANGNNTVRTVEGQFTYPQLYTDVNTGLTKVATRSNARWSAGVALDMTDAELAQFAAQFGNLVASSLIKSVHASGHAPT